MRILTIASRHALKSVRRSFSHSDSIAICFRTMSSKLYSVPLKLPEGLNRDQVLGFPAYKTWLASLEKSLDAQDDPSHPFHEKPYKLQSVKVQSCDFFGGGRLGFLKLKADIQNEDGEWLPGAVFMRGGSVAMLLILRARDGPEADEEYVILAIQPRIAAGSLSFVELPAGMLDDSAKFSGKAAQEIKEETGLEIAEDELIDMTKLTLDSRTQEQSSDEPHLQQAVYATPGGSDEFIPIFLARKEMSAEEIEGLKGNLTGLRDHGEKITLKICKLKDLWKVGARDGKTLAAVALYEGLRREGRL